MSDSTKLICIYYIYVITSTFFKSSRITHMNKYLIIFLIASGVLISSCKSTYVGGYAAIPKINIDYNLKADLKIDTTKVLQATSITSIYFKVIKIGDNNFSDAYGGNVGDREKSAATFKALNGTGFDIIVNPKYVVTVKRGVFVKKIQATVAGYGAKIQLK